MMDKELEQLLEGTENGDAFIDEVLNTQKDPNTRIETRSDKESLEVNKSADVMIIHDNGKDEESVKDELLRRKREKGKGIEETRDEPLPTPIRSLRNHIAPFIFG
uniref:Uncharacterized protein n=1 Tax=Tanacetum cinerariifolium TaxID=118510 RepID=A0A699JQX7_TANCI|nr:hypothetical protein [Tanacetum cinerariifolium]